MRAKVIVREKLNVGADYRAAGPGPARHGAESHTWLLPPSDENREKTLGLRTDCNLPVSGVSVKNRATLASGGDRQVSVDAEQRWGADTMKPGQQAQARARAGGASTARSHCQHSPHKILS